MTIDNANNLKKNLMTMYLNAGTITIKNCFTIVGKFPDN